MVLDCVIYIELISDIFFLHTLSSILLLDTVIVYTVYCSRTGFGILRLIF